jgi:hypothetical protein
VKVTRGICQLGEVPHGHERIVYFPPAHLRAVKLVAHSVVIRRGMKRLPELFDRRAGGIFRQGWRFSKAPDDLEGAAKIISAGVIPGIDEVPQFWNVLLGDMSIVGPRPHLIEHNKQFSQLMANYHVRAFVKPGITGLAQVRGFRGEARNSSDIENRVACDIEYLENWNLSLECGIILRTFFHVLLPPRTAY